MIGVKCLLIFMKFIRSVLDHHGLNGPLGTSLAIVVEK